MEQTPRAAAANTVDDGTVPSASAAEPAPEPKPKPKPEPEIQANSLPAPTPVVKDDKLDTNRNADVDDAARDEVAPTPQNAAASPAAPDEDAADPPLSKNQLKKRRRHEKALAIKRRRKEQSREVRRLKAQQEGRDLDAERRQQLRSQREGKGWAKREERWQEIVTAAGIDHAFRVCFDCAFEAAMTSKETNSLALQLRYIYSGNRKSARPVYVDVCGLTRGSPTRGHLEKVEGFPDKWVGRAFRCREELLEEVYGKSVHAKEGHVETGAVEEDGKSVPVKEGDGTGAVEEDEKGEGKVEDCATPKNDASSTHESGDQPPSFPKLPPEHQFVYLTGDSPNVLTTLDNNTTYIIGGIVDRNRLKRAAIDRAESIADDNPTLRIKTARLPLDEHVDFKSVTRILTCNHVFEILLKYRENGYQDWRGAIMAVLPYRKELEEKKSDEVRKESPVKKREVGKKEDSVNSNGRYFTEEQ